MFTSRVSVFLSIAVVALSTAPEFSWIACARISAPARQDGPSPANVFLRFRGMSLGGVGDVVGGDGERNRSPRCHALAGDGADGVDTVGNAAVGDAAVGNGFLDRASKSSGHSSTKSRIGRYSSCLRTFSHLGNRWILSPSQMILPRTARRHVSASNSSPTSTGNGLMILPVAKNIGKSMRPSC